MDFENKIPVDQQTVDEQAQWLAGGGGSVTGRITRKISERTSRRGAIARIGKWTLGATGVSLLASLPVSRAAAAAEPPLSPGYDGKDPSKCEYWRWCNMDGSPCASCEGGGVTTCAPGSKPGAEFWVGCCTNPDTKKTYLIAYYDCCGAAGCATSYCGEPQLQAQMYNPVPGGFDQEIVWCVSDETQSYTCTLAPIIGEDCTPRPAARAKASVR
jgi:methylamine dehydrogenase light chain